MPGRSALATVTPSPSAAPRQPRPRSGRTATASTTSGGARAAMAARRAAAAQRRGYAAAVVRGLARTHRGRAVAEIEQVLRASLPSLGVRLSAGARRELAVAIHQGRPTELA